jgi:hypothetical protein
MDKNGSMLDPGRKKDQMDGQWGQIGGEFVVQLIILHLMRENQPVLMQEIVQLRTHV